jgi:hypothetical protein
VIFISAFIWGNAFGQYPPHHFSAYVVQNGVHLETHLQEVVVKRAPFTVVVDCPDSEGVFVNVSFEKKTFKGALENVPVWKLPGFYNTALPELWNNPDGELFVAYAYPMYWFIESPKKHRFTLFQKINNRYVCERNVEKLFDMDFRQEIRIEDVTQPLYFTFIKFEVEGDNARVKELMRHEFMIVWE